MIADLIFAHRSIPTQCHPERADKRERDLT